MGADAHSAHRLPEEDAELLRLLDELTANDDFHRMVRILSVPEERPEDLAFDVSFEGTGVA